MEGAGQVREHALKLQPNTIGTLFSNAFVSSAQKTELLVFTSGNESGA
jgi:hypothetical protein